MPNALHVTERVFQSPSKYIQGPAAIKNAARYLAPLGIAPLLIADDIVFEIAGRDLVDALENGGFTVTRGVFGGEASDEEVQRMADLSRQCFADFVIALGGGKTIDTAKAAADMLALRVAVLPTTASTDAPCSALSVLYTPEGAFERYVFFAHNPALVLVDTSVIACAPPRFLAAGIGDALATHVEARAVRHSLNFGGGLPTEASAAIGEKCEEVLFKYATQALEANRAQAVTPAFEAVVEANTLLSGLGFESGGLAAAHAIHNALTAIDSPELHQLMHGEKVAFGIVCQLILDGAPTVELEKYLALLYSLGLPITFAQLGIPDVTEDELHAVAVRACAPAETIWNLGRVITEDVLVHALKGADATGRYYVSTHSAAA
ncbi:glycerol dehydrogenase [Sparassis latifolia]